ncbi:MAG TPA: 5'-nucleotidase C-terminal domain-containing protein [Ignavibacteria bacterium]|nr:5'-nucleotidase C-terminal domain-containing protein [Ignavibacteria bacterium]HMR39877.1 5'-nucleotidase C-terminal domain-containing protein [Ignavibacteria bacterium]
MNTVKNLVTAVFFFMFSFSQLTMGQGTQITILHTSDSHSHLDATGPKNRQLEGTLGGIAKVASIIGSVKQTEQNVLTLHAGDFCVGDFFYNQYFGVPELQIMKQIGFDALTVGNHEFDLGPQTLFEVLYAGFENGSFPVLSANLDLTGFPELSNFVQPYTIKEYEGVKVGIFGMTIPAPLSNPYPVLIQENLAEIEYATVMELRSLGADVIICLSHLGSNVDMELAANVPGIDFIISGHDHVTYSQPVVIVNPEGKNTRIVESGPFYQNIGKLNFTFENGEITFDSYTLIPVDNNVPAVPEIKEVIDQLKAGITEQYGNVYTKIIGLALCDLNTQPTGNNNFKDTPMGNLITDAFRKKTHTEISITADGLISDKIYRGAITGADIFRTVSYGYDTTNGLGLRLVTFDISGIELIKGLEVSLSMLGIDSDFKLQVSGMNFRYDPSMPVGERVILSSVRINNHPLDPGRMYSATVNEGLLGVLVSLGGVIVENVDFLPDNEYTVLHKFIKQNHFLYYRSEGRVRENLSGDTFTESDRPVEEFSYELSDNYPNPFNPVTKINYSVSGQQFTTLKIYDITGREVATLVNEQLSPGSYSVEWNASNFSSGVYIYRLQSGNFIETKKMTLIK